MNSDRSETPRSKETKEEELSLFYDLPNPEELRRETEQRQRQYHECLDKLVRAYNNQSPVWEEVLAKYTSNGMLSDFEHRAIEEMAYRYGENSWHPGLRNAYQKMKEGADELAALEKDPWAWTRKPGMFFWYIVGVLLIAYWIWNPNRLRPAVAPPLPETTFKELGKVPSLVTSGQSDWEKVFGETENDEAENPVWELTGLNMAVDFRTIPGRGDVDARQNNCVYYLPGVQFDSKEISCHAANRNIGRNVSNSKALRDPKANYPCICHGRAKLIRRRIVNRQNPYSSPSAGSIKKAKNWIHET
jgi:hypothetical protein